MGAAELLRKYLNEADPDLLRSMALSFAEALMSAEASGLCIAEYGNHDAVYPDLDRVGRSRYRLRHD
jgi:hypothetical protein